MFFTLHNFYILLSLSLSIRFNCWNFVSLWLWVALDLSFFCFCFHGILLVCGYGLSRFNFFCFLFFFLCKFPRFLLLPFVVKSMAKKNHEIFVIRFSFSLFFVFAIFIGFLVSCDSSIWFQFWVCFGLIYSVIVIFVYIGFPFL